MSAIAPANPVLENLTLAKLSAIVTVVTKIMSFNLHLDRKNKSYDVSILIETKNLVY